MNSQTEHSTVPAQQQWAEVRNAAGYTSDRALERAVNLSAGTIWTWITSSTRQRDPNIRSMRALKQVLGISLDRLDEILTAWRSEMAEAEKAKRSG